MTETRNINYLLRKYNNDYTNGEQRSDEYNKKMKQKFFEVFPTLQLEKKMKALLESTIVERVTSNRQKDFLRIYLQSDHLLQKEIIWETEGQIKKQLFPNQMMEIKIQEKYTL